jgi:hypothetical protein
MPGVKAIELATEFFAKQNRKVQLRKVQIPFANEAYVASVQGTFLTPPADNLLIGLTSNATDNQVAFIRRETRYRGDYPNTQETIAALKAKYGEPLFVKETPSAISMTYGYQKGVPASTENSSGPCWQTIANMPSQVSDSGQINYRELIDTGKQERCGVVMWFRIEYPRLPGNQYNKTAVEDLIISIADVRRLADAAAWDFKEAQRLKALVPGAAPAGKGAPKL